MVAREETMFGLAGDYRSGRRPSRLGGFGLARRSRRERFADGGVEPPLEDLMSDPMTAALMSSDGIDSEAVRAAVAEARKGLAAR